MAETSLRRRIPDLAVEAGMIFLAVVLALAAEEWREKRDRLELADRALSSVVAEIRSNLEELALLSTAAWQSAQMSQAVHYFDLDVMRQLSEAYEIQDLYERMQTSLVDGMGDLMRIARDDPTAAIRQGVSGVSMLAGIQDALVEVYRGTLDELEVGPAG